MQILLIYMILIERGLLFHQRLEEIMKRTRKTDTPEKVGFWSWFASLHEVAMESNVFNFSLPFPPFTEGHKIFSTIAS